MQVMQVYIYTYIYIYIYTYIYTYIHIYIYTFIYIYIQIYIYIFSYVHTYTIHTYLPTYLHTYIHIYVYIYYTCRLWGWICSSVLHLLHLTGYITNKNHSYWTYVHQVSVHDLGHQPVPIMRWVFNGDDSDDMDQMDQMDQNLWRFSQQGGLLTHRQLDVP